MDVIQNKIDDISLLIDPSGLLGFDPEIDAELFPNDLRVKRDKEYPHVGQWSLLGLNSG